MDNSFTLKQYQSIDEIILASFKIDDETITMEDIKSSMVGGVTSENEEVMFTYEQQVEGITMQGLWGWVDETKVIHYWIGKEVSIEELIHFFAHEIGHRTGKPDEDEFQEEMRAEGYGFTASLAYEFAKQIKQNNLIK